ncbi:uncharacterized protein LOC118435194 [Folsomia candida]|uniref:Uncharacterized protein n=1 Tax=Folsomia candida TaxID=158441 RepID=A0A226F4J8_FOLCA|nr:uncharacterized protein LOC118435194 [Folsomia candida]OXA64722.1 hypothetical protein Fcan01_01959 [Folsomia candida]
MSSNKRNSPGSSKRKDTPSEEGEETDESGSEQEDEHEYNKQQFKTKGEFLLSLQSVTKEQFLDKEWFARMIEKGQDRIKSQLKRRHMTTEMFKWEDQTLKYKNGNRWTTLEHVNTKRMYNINKWVENKKQREAKGVRKHQTYICITLEKDKIEGKTTREIWDWIREDNPPRGTYVGETFSAVIGAREGNFNRGQARPSALTLHLRDTGDRCFQVGVIITDSEDERKDLEEFILHYLAQHEEENCEMKMINKKTDFRIDPGLRAAARNLVHAGIQLTRFEETGDIDVANRYDLNYICTPEDFIEKTNRF